MTRNELRNRYPHHSERTLAHGYIPPMPNDNPYAKRLWPIAYWVVVSAACLAMGLAFALVGLAWWQGA